MDEEKARAIIANAEKVKAFNANKSYEDRRDYSYTSVAAAEKFLKGEW